jgi:hypothetical protein
LPKNPSSNFSRDSPDSPIGFASTCQNIHIRQTSINHFLPTTFQNFISHAQIHSLLKSNIWPLALEFSNCEYLVVFLNSCGYLHLPKTPSSNFSRDSPDSPIGFASTCQNIHIRQTPINHFKPTTLQNFISHELVESTDTLFQNLKHRLI